MRRLRRFFAGRPNGRFPFGGRSLARCRVHAVSAAASRCGSECCMVFNELAGSPLNRQEVFELCAELEGHPDNAAPAAFGGFTIARAGGYSAALSGRPRVGFCFAHSRLRGVHLGRPQRASENPSPRRRGGLDLQCLRHRRGVCEPGLRKARGMFRRSPAPAVSRKIGSLLVPGDRRGKKGGRSRGVAQRFGIHHCLPHSGQGGACCRGDACGMRKPGRERRDDPGGQ